MGLPVQGNLKLVTEVIGRAKLNEQSADRKPAKTNLLLSEKKRLSNFKKFRNGPAYTRRRWNSIQGDFLQC